jgi:methyl-accepting chemotaxis protein
MSFSNLRIARRLALSFTAIILVLTALCAVVITSLHEIDSAQALNVHTYAVLERATERTVAKPVSSAMAVVMNESAAGDNNVTIPSMGQRDEIGDMADAVLSFKRAAIDKIKTNEEAAGLRRSADEERIRNEAIRAKAAEGQSQAVRRLGKGLGNLAAGDLRISLDEGLSEAYAQIRDDFNLAISKLRETMTGVMSSADAIKTGTHEISSASDNLASRTEQQAASLEETAATLDEITETMRKSSEGANHASQVVAAADSDAKKSAVIVRQAVEAMGKIKQSSEQITNIIGVTDEIAFQTNLLALKAGVEAARAGDAGRGFAVVASEVRALAQRSAEAAKEIKGLISASSAQVVHGVRLVAETGESLERILAQMGEINTVVAGIAAGAKERATGLAEVNVAINRMDQMTQQNAAMVDESLRQAMHYRMRRCSRRI